MTFEVTVNGRSWRISLEAAEQSGRFVVGVNGRQQLIDTAWIDADTLSLIDPSSGEVREAGLCRAGGGGGAGAAGRVGRDDAEPGVLDVLIRGRMFRAAASPSGAGRSSRRKRHSDAPPVEGRQQVVSSMPGRVARVLVQVGDRVTARQSVVIVEAMKMENEIRSPKDGVVREVVVRESAAIERGALLMVIE